MNNAHEAAHIDAAGTSAVAKGSVLREAMPGILAALVAAVVALVGVMWQLKDARMQLEAQHLQVIEQLELQRESSQQLQQQQHELSVRQLEIQDRFSRDQIQFQRNLEESWAARQLESEKLGACAAQRAARADLRRSLYDQLSGALVELDETRRMELLYGAVQRAFGEAAGHVGTSADGFLFSEADWSVMKDLGGFFIEAELKTSARARAEARMIGVLLAIATSHPSETRALAADVQRLLPRSFFVMPEYSALMEKLGDAIRVSENGVIGEDAKSILAADFKSMLQRDIDHDLEFSNAVRLLRQNMIEAIMNQNESCS